MMVEDILKRVAAMAGAVQFVENLETQRISVGVGLRTLITDLMRKINGITAATPMPEKVAARSTKSDGYWHPFVDTKRRHAPPVHIRGWRQACRSEVEGAHENGGKNAARTTQSGLNDEAGTLAASTADNWLRPEAQVHRSGMESRSIDDAIQNRLSCWLGLRLPRLQVHTGPLLDTFLSAHNAHAMAWRGDLFVRSDQYHPGTSRGLALLGHEMTHIAQQDPNPSMTSTVTTTWMEQKAVKNEKLVMQKMKGYHHTDPARTSGHPSMDRTVDSPAVASGPVAPMFADGGRSIVEADLAGPASMLSENDMESIKQEVYRDILQKIRIDIERGA